MDWKEYQELAFKTNADLGDLGENNIHMLFGMITEIGELIDVYKKHMAYGKKIDWKNVKEEIGDFFWYVAGFAKFNEIPLENRMEELLSYGDRKISWSDEREHLFGISVCLGGVSNSLYKGKYIESGNVNLNGLLFRVFLFCHLHEFDVQRIWENNIEKLQSRYPENFTKEAALVRDLDAEAEILDE